MIEIYPASAGVDFFATAKDAYYLVVDEKWKLDATSILALSSKAPGADRAVCIFLGKKLSRPKPVDEVENQVGSEVNSAPLVSSRGAKPIERRPLLAGALSRQLLSFGIEATFLELLGTDDVLEVSPANSPLILSSSEEALARRQSIVGELGLSSVPYELELRSRFGDLFFEFDGVPYAKVQDGGEILTGTSFAEAEFLELSHEGRSLESLLANLRVSLMSCRSDKKYYEIFTSMWSRSLLDRALRGGISITAAFAYEPHDVVSVDAQKYQLGDYFRVGNVGVDPFGDLKRPTSGFYGHSGDPLAFALKRDSQGVDLLFVSLSLDISVAVKMGEIVESASSQFGSVGSVVLITSAGLMKFERVRELFTRLDFPIRILTVDEEWRSKEDIGVVDVGVY
ncbi:MAG: hypothetical protein M0019_06045 [Actinomycetota bacterium]|nr:hypothetical protein [Actinomycetota bacterium]